MWSSATGTGAGDLKGPVEGLDLSAVSCASSYQEAEGLRWKPEDDFQPEEEDWVRRRNRSEPAFLVSTFF